MSSGECSLLEILTALESDFALPPLDQKEPLALSVVKGIIEEVRQRANIFPDTFLQHVQKNTEGPTGH